MFGWPVFEWPMFLVSLLPRTAANLPVRAHIFRGPPWWKIGSSWCVEGEFGQFALKWCPICHSSRKTTFLCQIYRKKYLWWARILVGDPDSDQIGSGSFWSNPHLWKSFGSSRPDLSALQSNWSPSYRKSAGSENTNFTSAAEARTVALKRPIFKRKKDLTNLSFGQI
jgi:hypothetical protein